MTNRWFTAGPLTWFFAFVVGPLLILVASSFLTKGTYGGIEWIWTFKNYARILDPLYMSVVLNSILLSFQTTVLCLIFGVPIAIWMARGSAKTKIVLLFLVILPFLSNFIVRTFAIRSLLSHQSPLVLFFVQLGWLDEGTSLSQGSLAVSLGMLTNYLPLMILPVFVGFEKFEFTLLEAAKDLGANSIQAFFRVFLPNTWPALLAGSSMVFIPCLGEFVIPDMLGGAQVNTLGKLVSEQFLKTRDWPFGSSLALILVYCSVLSLIEWKRPKFLKAAK